MRLSRRQFNMGLAGIAGAAMMGQGRPAFAARDNELNILCWEGYNTDNVLGPFRELHAGARVRAESGTSDPDMINRLRAGELNVWDVLNVNQPWARRLAPEGLIKPLDKARFMPYFEKMSGEFAKPYPLAFADNGDLLGMPQRYGPFSFVVNTDKISRETVDLWARILRETPNSVLWVMCKTAEMEANLRKRFAERSVDPNRMIATAGVPYGEHIARVQLADLALDTFPCNGHTTTSDMLWAGLPVLAKRGQHFASRVSESLLNAIGLPELIAETDDDFVKLGITLARNPDRIATLRAHLAEQRFRAPLFDSERFCRHLESAFETMASRARNGEEPDHFDVTALPSRDGPFAA